MKTLLTFCFVLVAGTVSAQTITCMPFGQSTTCYSSQGQSTTITPMGNGLYSAGSNTGQMGTVYVPPTPQVQPLAPVAPRSSPLAPPWRR